MPDKIVVFQSLLKGNMAAQFSFVCHNIKYSLGSSTALLAHQLFMLHISHVWPLNAVGQHREVYNMYNNSKWNDIVMKYYSYIIYVSSAEYYTGCIKAIQ